MAVIIGCILFAAFLITFVFAACDVAHKYDESEEYEISVKKMLCESAQEICNQDCENCAWGLKEEKE